MPVQQEQKQQNGQQQVTILIRRKSSILSNKLVRCQKCFALLGKRMAVHNADDQAYILHIYHKGVSVYTYSAVITCYNCGSSYLVTGKSGIENSIPNNYFENPH